MRPPASTPPAICAGVKFTSKVVKRAPFGCRFQSLPSPRFPPTVPTSRRGDGGTHQAAVPPLGLVCLVGNPSPIK
ncbi:hypothetical protein J6590_069266 [Homalodisca vitripennis]|nr:hypothetical protein J6590_069266 [Homalodisca vitripennis]